MDPALDAVLDEVRLLYHRMVQEGERLHAGEPVTLGMRAVLEHLQRGGPAAVPALARRRFVSRQHVQALVNALLQRRLVALAPNPAHRRSALVTLAPEGRRTIERMRRREARFFAGRALGLSAAELRRTAGALARVRACLGGRP